MNYEEETISNIHSIITSNLNKLKSYIDSIGIHIKDLSSSGMIQLEEYVEFIQDKSFLLTKSEKKELFFSKTKSEAFCFQVDPFLEKEKVCFLKSCLSRLIFINEEVIKCISSKESIMSMKIFKMSNDYEKMVNDFKNLHELLIINNKNKTITNNQTLCSIQNTQNNENKIEEYIRLTKSLSSIKNLKNSLFDKIVFLKKRISSFEEIPKSKDLLTQLINNKRNEYLRLIHEKSD